MVLFHVISPLYESRSLSRRRVWRTRSRGPNYLHLDVGARKAPWLLTVLFGQYYCYSHPNNNICVAMMTDSVKLMERRQYSKRHEDEKTLCGWIIFVFFNIIMTKIWFVRMMMAVSWVVLPDTPDSCVTCGGKSWFLQRPN